MYKNNWTYFYKAEETEDDCNAVMEEGRWGGVVSVTVVSKLGEDLQPVAGCGRQGGQGERKWAGG